MAFLHLVAFTIFLFMLLTGGFWNAQPRLRGWRTPGADGNPYFCLEDLWDTLREWSAFGVEVPLLLSESDSVKQYYVPYLSGIQLYLEPHRLRSVNFAFPPIFFIVVIQRLDSAVQ